jgi:outer membrane receptor for ferrienterochelin and colicins
VEQQVPYWEKRWRVSTREELSRALRSYGFDIARVWMRHVSTTHARNHLAAAFRSFAVIWAVLSAGGAIAADPDQESTSALPQIIVTTTRQPRRIADEPTRIEVIDQEELGEKVAMSPGDVAMLLNETSGLRVQMTSPGLGAANVRIEGLQGRYSQILADGLPLYGGQAGSIGLLQIPPLDLGQVEVLKGVASALYGPSALGGVINFVSRRPDGAHELLLNETSRQETDAALWWSGEPATTGWSYSVLASLNRQTIQDVDGDGWADMPTFRRAVVRPRVYWRDDSGRELYLTTGAMLEDRTGGTIAGGRVPSGDPNGIPYVEALKTQRYDAGLTGRLPIGPDRTLTVRASFTDRDLRQTFGDVYEPTHYRTGIAEVGLNGASGPHAWVVGVAFQQDRYRDDAFRVFDFTYTVPAMFAQDDYDVSDSLTLSASGRVDHHNQYGRFFSPRLAMLWRPGGRSSPWWLRLSVGSGFFAPAPVTEETEATGLARVLPLAGLRAERARGLSADLNRLWTLSHSSLETNVTVFGSTISNTVNLIEVSTIPPRFAFANDPHPTRTFGTEELGRWRAGPFAVTHDSCLRELNRVPTRRALAHDRTTQSEAQWHVRCDLGKGGVRTCWDRGPVHRTPDINRHRHPQSVPHHFAELHHVRRSHPAPDRPDEGLPEWGEFDGSAHDAVPTSPATHASARRPLDDRRVGSARGPGH